ARLRSQWARRACPRWPRRARWGARGTGATWAGASWCTRSGPWSLTSRRRCTRELLRPRLGRQRAVRPLSVGSRLPRVLAGVVGRLAGSPHRGLPPRGGSAAADGERGPGGGADGRVRRSPGAGFGWRRGRCPVPAPADPAAATGEHPRPGGAAARGAGAARPDRPDRRHDPGRQLPAGLPVGVRDQAARSRAPLRHGGHRWPASVVGTLRAGLRGPAALRRGPGRADPAVPAGTAGHPVPRWRVGADRPGVLADRRSGHARGDDLGGSGLSDDHRHRPAAQERARERSPGGRAPGARLAACAVRAGDHNPVGIGARRDRRHTPGHLVARLAQESLVTWTITPRDADLGRTLDEVSIWDSLTVVERYNQVSTWVLEGPAELLNVFTPDMGCILDKDGEQRLSGIVRAIDRVYETDDEGRVVDRVTLGFVEDSAPLWWRLCWPDPSHALSTTMSTFSAAHDVRSDARESILLGYLGANLGPAAPIAS